MILAAIGIAILAFAAGFLVGANNPIFLKRKLEDAMDLGDNLKEKLKETLDKL